MTIAGGELFELCEQVYEVTGWKPTDWQHGIENGQPLYTSDYLLEKLPKEIDGYPITLQAINGWQASLCYDGAEDIFAHKGESDTPLKALLKLVLALPDECISKGATQ